MAEELRRRQAEETTSRNAVVPSDAASMATMIGAMLIGLSATDVVYRDAAARGVDRPALDPGPDVRDEPRHDGGSDTPDAMPFHHADDPDGSQPGPVPAMEVLPPPPHWDPWTRFDPLDSQVIDVTDNAPSPAEGAATSTPGSSGMALPASASAGTAAAVEGAAAATHLAGDTSAADTVLASTVTTAHDVIGDTVAALDAAVGHIASSVHDFVQPLTAAIESTTEQIGSAVDQLGAAIGETVDAVGGVVQGVTELAADLPAAILGGPEAPAIPDPVFTEAFKPDLPDADAAAPVHDLLSPVTDLTGSITEPLHLGFLGQSTMDGMDAHDGAFSIFGSHI